MSKRRYILCGLIALAFLAGSFFIGPIALAQDTGLSDVQSTTGLSNQDIRITIGNIINIILGFLGIVAMLYVLYGGFVWMTAGGDATKVDKAKKILINGVIGVVIILSSLAITSFVISSLLNSSGAGSGSSGDGGNSGGGLGGGSSASFIISDFVPEGEVEIRNIQVQITFNRNIDTDSVADDTFRIERVSNGTEVEGEYEVSGNKVTFTPNQSCPEPNEDYFCFEENASYIVQVSGALQSTDGLNLDCATAPCESTFTSGEIVDTQNPQIEIVFPENGDRIPVGSEQLIQVQAIDDYGVGTSEFYLDNEQFDAVAASGSDLADVLIETLLDTSILVEGENYGLSSIVYDLAGNTDEDGISITGEPAHCSNGVQDEDETGLDCGGAGCAACDGNACTEDSECSGSCEDGTCVSLPIIEDMSPRNGAPGTFVTLTGSNFGSSTGEVYFTGTEGLIEAELPSCSDGWSSTVLTVEVPEGAIDGAVTVVTSSGNQDITNDDNGPIIEDFDINDVERPSICRLSPSSGAIGSEVSVSGANFGTSQDPTGINESNIFFGDTQVRTYQDWSDDSVQILIPTVEEGEEYGVYIVVDGVQSNEIPFNVVEQASDAPILSYTDPENGGIGQYVTLIGSNFGASTGTVWFEDEIDGTILASVDFPSACLSDYWNDDQVIVIVPEEVEAQSYNIYVENVDGDRSNNLEFQVTTADPRPSICAIDPDAGDVGDIVTIYGAEFGSSAETIVFSNEITVVQEDITSWQDNEIQASVPSGAETGPVNIRVGEEESNGVNFEIGGSDSDAGSTSQAEYAWTFSTGEIPITPELIVNCSETQVSGVPNQVFTNEVCVNAVVYGAFNTRMIPSTLSDAIIVENCGPESSGNICASTTQIAGALDTVSSTDSTIFTWVPEDNAQRFDISTRYQVTITTDAISEEGLGLAQDISWQFVTSSSAADCAVEEVIVSPEEEILTSLNQETEFSAVPVTDECQVLDADAYSWSWNVDASIAGLSESCEDESGDSCVTIEALAQGESDVIAQISTGESGSGNLVIDFTDPYIQNYWPDCRTACVNAEVGGSFNIAMEESSVESTGAITLYKCESEFCLNLTEISNTASCINEGDGCTGFFVDLEQNLDTQSYYRVIVSGEIYSESGVPLTRVNYGEDYSWVFLTREDQTECAVSSLELEPNDAILNQIGESQHYKVTPFGEADSCSIAGQRLNGYDYAWDWTNPIVDEAGIAEWYQTSTTLLDVDINGIPAGCTDSCLSQGSEPIAAICGDGILSTDQGIFGEDCDDGNFIDGDGCSSTCQNEGSQTCSLTCAISGGACGSDSDCTDEAGDICAPTGENCCGNGILEGAEECDAGDVNNGDGCSAICLNEGSAATEAICTEEGKCESLTCGDKVITQDSGIGGEDCDDGNTRSGDGCSSICLNEGSVPLIDLDAVCGDGEIDRPWETCDDGNLNNGDGCSSTCLREGAAGSIGTCDGVEVERDELTGAGEDCDGGEGCGTDCTWQGSSLDYDSPSICGDGVVGTGEVSACEEGNAGDGNIDPVQLAVISSGAASFVDDESGRVSTTIEVSGQGLTTSTDLTLLCSAQSDDDCQEGYGVDQNGCCALRPEASLYPSGSDICRNTAVYAVFTDEMDLGTFNNNVFVTLDLSDAGGICPEDYEVYSGSEGDLTFLQRVWRLVRGVFIKELDAQEAGDCIVPITNISQSVTEEGDYRISFAHETLLEPLATHTLTILGSEEENTGVKTASGVAMEETVSQSFITAEELCQLEVVDIQDESDSPGLFTTFEEVHDFIALPYTLTTGGVLQEIEPISGVYNWVWNDWLEDSDGEIIRIDQASGANTAQIASQRINGEATIIVEAEITEDSSEGSEGEVIAGDYDIVVNLCEYPWPAHEHFPFIDDATGTQAGTEEGAGWMNFSTYYCRDNSGGELLPEVQVVLPNESGSSAVIKEYLFQIGSGRDAIGIRIASNPEYLSPLDWYVDQGFTGSPSEIVIDGFEAISDGRTVYISAPNISEEGKALYSNIYVISYNEGASSEAINIHGQILDNFNFVTNANDVNLCIDGSNYTDTICSSDFDCNTSNGEYCASEKDAITRDTKRLSDIRNIESALSQFGSQNGLCSQTNSQSCTNSDECPTGESCLRSYPTLPSGTFIRSLSSSAWASWQDVFGSLLSVEVDIDPLNQYASCGEGIYAEYNQDTCVNESSGAYLCPKNSYAYHYRALGEFGYELSAELEYENKANYGWVNDIDLDAGDDLVIQIGGASGASGKGFSSSPAFCNAAVYGDSSICGDGIIGESGGAVEVCEIGEEGASIACEVDGIEGTIATVCNSTCSGFVEDDAASCVVFSCGNGVLETGEICDDGSLNGQYGYCGADCTYDSAFYCGDGTLAGGEVCDCGATSISSYDNAYSGGSCAGVNGTYDIYANTTCAWDCSGPASYCGDGIVESGEQCDGNVDIWEGELCRGGGQAGMPCSSDSDCGGGSCGAAEDGFEWAGACPNTSVCLGGSDDGLVCSSDSDCEDGGICSTFNVQTTRIRSCIDSAWSSDSEACTWDGDDWRNIECRSAGSCGDGVLDEGEICDDGNTNTNDACTNECTANTCGDGYLYSGVEQCDEGEENGLICSASYGSTCNYCSPDCRLITSSGAFCGDGVTNGGEYCDGTDIPYQWTSIDEQLINGTCSAEESGSTTTARVDGVEILFTCQNVGICNGGRDGRICLQSNQCGTSGECVKPVCGSNCTNSCPFVYEGEVLVLEDNQVGSSASSGVDLISFDQGDDEDEVLGDPNIATITVPACRVADNLIADISFDNIERPNLFITFVTDLSQSMLWSFDGDHDCSSNCRIDVTREVLSDAVSTLYDELTTKLYTSHVVFDGDGAEIDGCGLTGWCDYDDASESLAIVEGFSAAEDAVGTPTDEALQLAEELIELSSEEINLENSRYIIVLLSDGEPYYTDLSDEEALSLVDRAASRVKSNGLDIELYTVAITDVSSFISDMNEWSSGNPNPETGIDYAYDGDSAADLSDAYEQIVDSISYATIQLYSDSESYTAMTVDDGLGVELSLPDGFTCDENNEQQIPLHASFRGEGTIQISNVQLNYCKP